MDSDKHIIYIISLSPDINSVRKKTVILIV